MLRSAEAELSDAADRAGLPSLVLAGWFSLYTGEGRTARALADRALALNESHPGALALSAWVDVTAGTALGLGPMGAPTGAYSTAAASGPTQSDGERVLQGLQTFRSLLDGVPPSQQEPDVALGYAHALVRCGMYDAALETLGALSAAFPWYSPAISARADVLIRLGDWESARVLLEEHVESGGSADVEAHRLLVLIALVVDGPKESTAKAVQALVSVLTTVEPRHPRLYLTVSSSVARLACASPLILKHTVQLMELACTLDPDTSVYASELGLQLLQLGHLKDALTVLNRACSLDSSNPEAVSGLIQAQLTTASMEDVQEAAAQLEMFRMIAHTIGKSAVLYLLESLLALHSLPGQGPEVGGTEDGQQGEQGRQRHVDFLGKALEAHSQALQSLVGSQATQEADQALRQHMPTSATSGGGGTGMVPVPRACPPSVPSLHTFYATLQPQMIMDIAQNALVQQSSHDDSGAVSLLGARLYPDCSDAASPGLRLGLQALTTVFTTIPGCIAALQLTALAKSASGDVEGAQRAIGRVLARDPSSIDAHLLLASLEMKEGQPRAALATLERCLAMSFTVQQSPVYHRLKAQALHDSGRGEETLRAIETGLKLSSASSSTGTPLAGAATVADKAFLLQLQVKLLLQLHRVPDATTAAHQASVLLKGTREEGVSALCHARIAMAASDPEAALQHLHKVPSSSHVYEQALEAKADIYLHHRRDRQKYIRCFVESIRRHGGTRSGPGYQALGDALARVSQHEHAVLAYAQAAAQRPSDTSLVLKLGRSVFSLHEFQAAVAFYQAALTGDLPGAVAVAVGAAQYAADATGTRLDDDPSTAGLLSTEVPYVPAGSGRGLDRSAIRTQLATLFMQLKRYADARALIQGVLDSADVQEAIANTGKSDILTLRFAREHLLLLSKVHMAAGAQSEVLAALSGAYDIALRCLDAARRAAGPTGAADVAGAGLISVDEERRAVAVLSLHLAQACLDHTPPELEKGQQALVAAMRHAEALPHGGAVEASLLKKGSPGVEGGDVTGGPKETGSGPASLWEQAALALAAYHLQQGEDDQCRAICASVLKANPSCGDAALLSADILFRGGDVNAAIYNFSTFLEAPGQATNWDVLYKLAHLLKRAGKAAETSRFLKAAAAASSSAEHSAGYKLVQGLLYMWTGDIAAAVRNLNAARASPAYALQSVKAMAMLYLSPDSDPLWLDRDAQAEGIVGQDTTAASAASQGQQASAREILSSIDVVNKLIEDLPPGLQGRDSPSAEVLRAYCLMLSGRAKQATGAIEDAIGKLAGILEAQPDYVPALLALSTAFLIQGQSSKARNTVKRLLKTPGHEVQYGQEACSAWLLLADLYAEQGKLDQASEALNRALAVDVSSSRAHEVLGGIAERELR